MEGSFDRWFSIGYLLVYMLCWLNLGDDFMMQEHPGLPCYLAHFVHSTSWCQVTVALNGS